MTAISLDYIAQGINDLGVNFCCPDTHPGVNCNQKFFLMFIRALKPVAKTYIPVHVVPFLLFKRKKFMKDPLKQLLQLIIGIIRSILFGAGYYCTHKRFLCLLFGNNKCLDYELPLSAGLGGVSLLVQPPNRQCQIALFTMYKSFETLYNMGKRRNMAVRVPAGNCIITAMALSIICYHYFTHKSSIKKSYVQIIDNLLQNC